MALLKSSLLDEAGFDHGFGTRESVTQEIPDAIYTVLQVHGDRIITLQEPLPKEKYRFAKGDALITRSPGIFIGIRTADCLPVLMADPATGSVAAVHCGWRSLAKGLAGNDPAIIGYCQGGGE